VELEWVASRQILHTSCVLIRLNFCTFRGSHDDPRRASIPLGRLETVIDGKLTKRPRKFTRPIGMFHVSQDVGTFWRSQQEL
jgi:hypothetical protein